MAHLFDDLGHVAVVERLFPVFLFRDKPFWDIGKDLLYLEDLGEIRLAEISLG